MPEKRKTFTVAEVYGSARTSLRDYTHAVIGQFDFDAEECRLKSQWADTKSNKSSYAYDCILAKAAAGESYGKYKAGYNFTIASARKSCGRFRLHKNIKVVETVRIK